MEAILLSIGWSMRRALRASSGTEHPLGTLRSVYVKMLTELLCVLVAVLCQESPVIPEMITSRISCTIARRMASMWSLTIGPDVENTI